MNHSGESTRAASGPRRVDRHHVVVVGAGFGGLAAAKSLAGLPVDVTVIDSRNHHTFQPLLYQVATAGLDGDDICFPVRGVFAGQDNVRVRLGTVTDVDIERAALRLGDGSTLGYDDLVLAAGAVTNPFGIPGVEEHAYGLKSLRDALALRSHVLMRFETADTDPVHLTDGTLTVVVAGGGPTGVELAGGLIELSTMVLRHDYPGLDLRSARVVLVEAGDRLLPGFHPNLSAKARDTLENRGVEVMLNTAVSSVDATTVRLGDGSEIAAHTMVWTAGVRAHPLAETLGVELTKGARIVVGPDLSVPGYPRVHVVGDMAGATDSSGALLPQVAPVAMQSAEYVADKIRHRIHGESVQPFEYTDKGSMATIGRHDAVAQLPGGIRMSGVVGWFAWLLLHLVMLIGFRNRANVLVNWAWNYVTYDRASRIIPDVHHPEESS
ncbi:MAG: NAD(P)/FAD-dependent oxidoreductase [Microthrixaceae bacterium]